MFKNLSEKLDKPVTWKGYLKLAGICGAIGAIITAAEIVYFWWDEISERLSRIENKITRLFDKQ